jgi:hypothetical protein
MSNLVPPIEVGIRAIGVPRREPRDRSGRSRAVVSGDFLHASPHKEGSGRPSVRDESVVAYSGVIPIALQVLKRLIDVVARVFVIQRMAKE